MDPHDTQGRRLPTEDSPPQQESSPEDTASPAVGNANPTASFTPQPAAQRLRRAATLDGPAKPQRLGRFVLKARLGEGAFGRVYLAHDPQLDREVALKVAHAHRLTDDDDRQKFFREGRAAAQLEHPNIVRVYEVGTHGEHAYIVSALVKGESLDKLLAREKPGVVRSVRLVVQLCGGLHHAHLRGVFHRDIKPANILMDEAGVPHLADFGVARRSEGEALRTVDGAVVGTPAYMSPEQARGESRKVDARSDLYSVGVLLYELLAGRRPFRGDALELLRQLRSDDVPRLRKFNPRVPADLEAICMKALAREPQQRYPSVQHFVDDLTRWLENRPVLARRIGPVMRMRKWVRRHPLASGLAATAVAVAIGVGAYVQTRPAYLDVRVSPGAGVRATLDGVPLAIDPNGRALVEARPGPAMLRVEADGFEPHEQQVQLVRGRANAALTTIELRSRYGFVVATSDPKGARVELIDAAGSVVEVGTTPYRSSRVPAGRYSLRFLLDLHETATAPISVPNGDRTANAGEIALKAKLKGAASYARMKETLRVLAQPTQFDFVEVPLEDVLQFLREQHDIAIVVDRAALEAVGVRPDQLVTLALKGLSLSTGLRQLLQPLHLTFVPDQDASGNFLLLVTTAEAADERLIAIVYSVRELGLVGTAAEFDNLISSITNQIEPASWVDAGGGGSITPNRALGTLTITQPWEIHRHIDSYLADLRLEGLAGRRAPAVERAQGPPSESYAGLQKLRQLLDQPASIAVQEVPLRDALRQFADAHKISVILNEPDLNDVGISADTPVTYSSHDGTLVSVLDGLLHPLHLEWIPAEDAGGLLIEVTSREAARSLLVAIVYSVADLVGGPQPSFGPLIDALELEVEPSFWNRAGGPGSITQNRDQQAISVSCPWRTHCRIDDHLALIRRRRAGQDDDPIYRAAQTKREELVAAIVRLGGSATCNDFRSTLPVLTVSFAKTSISDADLELLARLPDLTSLDLSSAPISDEGLRHVAGLTGITVLNLHQTAITDSGLAHLAGLMSLRTLILSSTGVTDAGLVHVANASWLRTLNLDHCNITDAGLDHLAPLRKLNALSLSYTSIGDAGLERLASLNGLQGLGLYRTRITDAGLAHLAGIRGMRWLDLGGTAVADAGLERLAALPQLQSLWLHETAVSDAGLAHLKQLKRLTNVRLGATQVSSQGAADLQRALPSAIIQR